MHLHKKIFVAVTVGSQVICMWCVWTLDIWILSTVTSLFITCTLLKKLSALSFCNVQRLYYELELRARKNYGRWNSQISNNSLYTVHTNCLPASQDSSQHIKCWKLYAVIYGLVLLKIGTVVPETCWANRLLINHNCCIKLVSHIIHIKDARSHEHQIPNVVYVT